VASLSALLLAVGRYNSLESAYIASRMPLVVAVWDEAAALLSSSSSTGAAAGGGSGGGLGGSWLLLLYNNLMGLLEGDAAWLSSCLPGQRRQLLLALITASFDKVCGVDSAGRSCRGDLLLGGHLVDAFFLEPSFREWSAAAAAAAATCSSSL
jgi:hypothetical protein